MIANNVRQGFFKVPAAVPQTPLDRTTLAARQLISDALKLRDANISRLRAMRLAKMADDEAAISTSVPEKRNAAPRKNDEGARKALKYILRGGACPRQRIFRRHMIMPVPRFLILPQHLLCFRPQCRTRGPSRASAVRICAAPAFDNGTVAVKCFRACRMSRLTAALSFEPLIRLPSSGGWGPGPVDGRFIPSRGRE